MGNLYWGSTRQKGAEQVVAETSRGQQGECKEGAKQTETHKKGKQGGNE